MPNVSQTIDWHQRARDLKVRGEALVAGRRVSAQAGATFACLSPIDGRTLAQVAAGEAADIDAAVASGRQVFESGAWARQSPAARKAVLQKFSALIEAAKDELALLETLDMGKPIRDALAVDVPATARCIRWYAEAIDKVYGEVAPTAPDVLATITREPLGVISRPAIRWCSSLRKNRRSARCASLNWRSRRACRQAYSTWCQDSATPRARRWLRTWMSMA